MNTWLETTRQQTEAAMAQMLDEVDDRGLDSSWEQALQQAREYGLRPSKRLRPAMVVAGHAFGRGDLQMPAGLWRFAAATEWLHTFMLVHDDIADQAEVRRGGSALHRMLGAGRRGEDLAVVVGDHLFSLAVEQMLACGQSGAAQATRYFLRVCRHTAAGQFLDLSVPGTPLAQLPLSRVLRVAYLKTALYGFSAPLVCGAMMAGASEELLRALERFGRHVGIAYQLQDDLLGLYGQAALCGKPTDSDLAQGKRTFPVLAAALRAPAQARQQLEALWTPGPKDEAQLELARYLVEAHGGRAATERLILRSTQAARRVLARLPEAGGMRQLLEQLLMKLMCRSA